MKPLSIHLVSFQWPVPADYGGVIDVFHKIRALRQAGAEVTLHSYAYRDRKNPDISLSPADHTFIYDRDTSPLRLLSSDPYIVRSRRSNILLERLAQLPPGTPVIFEGLHTCSFLSHPLLADKFKIVRAHNVEHDYYSQLARNASGLRRLYLDSEARKLARYVDVLGRADLILAISPDDCNWYKSRFPSVPVVHIPCFYNDENLHKPLPEPLSPSVKPYLLYHGNLGVEENKAAVEYILSRLRPLLPADLPIVFAGRYAPASLSRKIAAAGATHFSAPSPAEMQSLIADAAVTLLITNQNTGIKLKLLDTLASARGHILATTQMAADPALNPLLSIADSPSEQAQAIREMLLSPPSLNRLAERRERLSASYDTSIRAREIISHIK